MRSFFAWLVVCALAAPSAIAANSFSNDVTDLWWNPDESGWGINIIQQSNVLFATLFVFDQDGRAHWYVASDMTGASAPSDQPYRFTGRLYETTGPAFTAASFAAAAVTRRDVGSIFFEFMPPNAANLSYTVDGVTVNKQVTRQTWTANDLSGKYFGGHVTQKSPFATAGCAAKTGVQMFDDITITQSGTSVSMTAVLGGAPPQELCTYTGTYSQAGHMGAVDGVYSCNGGANGPFTLRELEIGVNGLAANYSASDRGCAIFGNFSAVRTN